MRTRNGRARTGNVLNALSAGARTRKALSTWGCTPSSAWCRDHPRRQASSSDGTPTDVATRSIIYQRGCDDVPLYNRRGDRGPTAFVARRLSENHRQRPRGGGGIHPIVVENNVNTCIILHVKGDGRGKSGHTVGSFVRG